MRRQIFLHIGFPKTGTTSIQIWFTENAAALAAHGVLYPGTGRIGQEYDYGHHQLPRSLVESPLSELTIAWPVMATLHDEIANSPAQTIVLSSEDFSTRLRQQEVELLAERLVDFDVRIVCYVRRQDEFIISIWSTAVAHYGESDPLSCCLDHSWLDYAGTIAPWAGAFGPGAIVLRVFERSQLVGGDAVEDFLSVCGIDASAGLSPLDHTHHNRRLPAHISLIQAYLNGHKIDRATTARLSALSSLLGHRETGTPLFARGGRIALLERHATGNRSLAQTYLGRADGRLFYDLTMPDDGTSSLQVNAYAHGGDVASAIALLVDEAHTAVCAGSHSTDATGCRDLPESFRSMSDDEWLETLLKSTIDPIIDGFRFPGYPDTAPKAASVGLCREAAVREAFNFYVLTKAYARALAMPLMLDGRFLDFGVGWGQFLRVFWKEVRATNLYGCDVDPHAITTCQVTGVPGQFDRLCSQGRLPYPDGFLRGGIACSAFTQLSQPAHLHWMSELGRVLHPGAVFCMTLRSESNADTVRKQPDVPLSFVEREWAGKFAMRAYVDRPSQYGGAVVILQRL